MSSRLAGITTVHGLADATRIVPGQACGAGIHVITDDLLCEHFAAEKQKQCRRNKTGPHDHRLSRVVYQTDLNAANDILIGTSKTKKTRSTWAIQRRAQRTGWG